MSDKPVATFTGWMPNGVKTTLAIVLNETAEDFDRVLNYQNMFLSRGFALEDPAFGKLKAGEKRETINGVLRRKDQKNGDGTLSPTFDLYPDNPALGRRCLIINLDTPEEIADFERATGHKVSDFKIYVAAQLNRKEEPGDYAEYAKQITGNVAVVFKDNPGYDPTAEKKKRQHLFIRWEIANTAPATTPASQPATAQASEPKQPEPPRNARLQNEGLVITRMIKTGVVAGNKDPKKNGFKYDGWGKIDDNGQQFDVRVWIFPEDLPMIAEAGYEFHEGGENYIPVILDITDRAMTRIAIVVPKAQPKTERTWDAEAWEAVKEYAESFEEDVAAILGVSKGSEWKRGYNAAIKTIDTYIAKRPTNVDFMGQKEQKTA